MWLVFYDTACLYTSSVSLAADSFPSRGSRVFRRRQSIDLRSTRRTENVIKPAILQPFGLQHDKNGLRDDKISE